MLTATHDLVVGEIFSPKKLVIHWENQNERFGGKVKKKNCSCGDLDEPCDWMGSGKGRWHRARQMQEIGKNKNKKTSRSRRERDGTHMNRDERKYFLSHAYNELAAFWKKKNP